MANWVQDIRGSVPATHWRHVPSTQNPADLASRGVYPVDLLSSHLWWDGPPWLHQSPDHWPAQPKQEVQPHLPDIRHVLVVTTPRSSCLWSLYSDLKRLVRITAWLIIFAANCRYNQANLSPHLTAKELEGSMLKLWFLFQREHLKQEVDELSEGKSLPSSSPLFPLLPVLDP